MNVEQFGTDPARLRKFLRDMSAQYRQEFTTPDAMDALDLGEPEGTQVLVAMAEAKWLVYLGQEDGFDRWKVGRLGIQYSLKNFLKRMPVVKAEALLERTLARVREFNQSDASTRITQVTLFGSLAKGGDEEKTVGDIDLQLMTSPRSDISEDKRAALLATEMQRAPKGSTMEFEDRFWAEKAGIRHLRAMSKRLTVSTHDNIGDMGCEHMIVYQFDAKTGTELPCDRRLIPADHDKQAQFNVDAEHEAPLPAIPAFRPWPDVPRRKSTGLYSRRRVDRSIAQYLWQRGRSLKEIARRENVKEIDVQAVLAQCGTTLPDPASIIMTSSPVDALTPLLADFPNVSAHVRLGNFGSLGSANVHLRSDHHHAMCTSSASRSEPKGDPELARLAEVLATAAALWHKRFRSKIPKIELSMDFEMADYPPTKVAEASTMRSATECGRAFNQLFDKLYNEIEFEPLYDRKLRSLGLSLDLLRLELSSDDRDASRELQPSGEIVEVARDLGNDLVGEHSTIINSIELRRFKSEWEDPSRVF